jgi:hypothetical protein
LTHPSNISADKILTTKEFSDFLKAAKNFCAFIETQQRDTSKGFLLLTQTQLLTLYSLGQNIPPVSLESNADIDTNLSDTEMKSLLKTISDRVPFAYYWTVLNPIDINNSAVIGTGDLVDDLGDIYKDLKQGLLLFDMPDFGAKENAIWKFRFDFDYHWRKHCIEALNAIHHYLQNNK